MFRKYKQLRAVIRFVPEILPVNRSISSVEWQRNRRGGPTKSGKIKDRILYFRRKSPFQESSISENVFLGIYLLGKKLFLKKKSRNLATKTTYFRKISIQKLIDPDRVVPISLRDLFQILGY